MNMQSPFTGRMSRKNFIWAQVLLIFVVLTPLVLVLNGDFSFNNIMQKSDQLLAMLLFMAPLSLLFQFICSFRRLHDIGQNGLWALLLFSSLVFIPLLDMIFLIYISYKKGDENINQYGIPDTRTLIQSVFNTKF
jgi:uncharacterized membrane protein YhaH (DUF805 family)